MIGAARCSGRTHPPTQGGGAAEKDAFGSHLLIEVHLSPEVGLPRSGLSVAGPRPKVVIGRAFTTRSQVVCDHPLERVEVTGTAAPRRGVETPGGGVSQGAGGAPDLAGQVGLERVAERNSPGAVRWAGRRKNASSSHGQSDRPEFGSCPAQASAVDQEKGACTLAFKRCAAFWP